MPLLIDSLDSILHGVFLQKPQTIVDQVYDAIQLEVQNDKEIKKLAYSRYITFYMENRRVGRLAGSYVGREESTIEQIKRYTSCKICIYQGKCEFDGAKKVTICDGGAIECYVAKRMIQTLFPKCVWLERGEPVTV